MTALLALAVLLLQAPPAPLGTLTIQGTVTDPSRAMMPGVPVSVNIGEAKLSRLTLSDENGRYSIFGLPPGRYEVVADLPGFVKVRQTIELSDSLTLDLQLKVVPDVWDFGIRSEPELAPLLPNPFEAVVARRAAGIRLASQLWEFSMQPQAMGRPTEREERRSQRVKEFFALGPDAIPGLNLALQDPDTLVRRNATLVLMELGGGFSPPGRGRVDIIDALPALIAALQDTDGSVRAWSAQAIGTLGPSAARAIPSLIQLLSTGNESDRNSSCFALGTIGPAAKDALPMLRNALNDTSNDVRRFARTAIDKIDVR